MHTFCVHGTDPVPTRVMHVTIHVHYSVDDCNRGPGLFWCKESRITGTQGAGEWRSAPLEDWPDCSSDGTGLCIGPIVQ